ncbi:MAG TPA: sensor histidine kinase [Candidatus Limiplasma sp.]|nr:sensor histidine kinase [Candidatus Limiplasma sp.]HPS80394.1 sensor histidine kinase [Candidatus Limiplasma sp.]
MNSLKRTPLKLRVCRRRTPQANPQAQPGAAASKRRMALHSRIFLSFSLILMVLAGLMYTFIFYTEEQVKQIYYDRTVESLKVVSENLSDKLAALQGSIALLCSNSIFDAKLAAYLRSDNPTPDVQTIAYFSEALDELCNNHEIVRQVILCTPGSNFYSLAQESLRYGNPLDNPEIQQLLSDSGGAMHVWGKSMDNPAYSTPGKVVPLIVTYRQQSMMKLVRVIVLVDENYLYQEINRLAGESQNVILNSKSEPVIAISNKDWQTVMADPGWLEAQSSHKDELWEAKYGGKNLFVVSTSLVGNMHWTLVGLSEKEKLLGRILAYRQTMVWTCLLSLAVFFLFAFSISRTITKPLYRLRDTMKRVANREFDAQFIYGYNDVVGDLGESFNIMVAEIKSLVGKLEDEREQVRIQQLLKRRAELKALQAQINPHFLYNTLDSINWMATDAGAEDISEIAIALANLFRSGLKRGNELSPLEDELTHVTSYLKIQKMRYQERFDYQMEIPQEMLEYYSIRLLLQPLAENSIYHGIKPTYQKGNIRIGGALDLDRVRLWVMDDGVGIEPARMAEMNQKLSDHVVVDKAGYGIFNVNERINLYFGEPYGLQYRRDGVWTVAEITLPRITQEEVERYVQYPDRR